MLVERAPGTSPSCQGPLRRIPGGNGRHHDGLRRGDEGRRHRRPERGEMLRRSWNPADAIHAAARYLHANGAPRDYDRAIYTYNN